MRSFNRNLTLYPWYLASTYEGISNAVWYLYLFTYKGLSLGEMAWLVLLGDGVIVLSEVPTGWLADRMGRRASVLFGIFLQALSAVLFIFGDSFITFWLAIAVCGLGDTFRSGADQALLYDSCRVENATGRFRRILAGSMFIATVVMCVSQVSGGLIVHFISWELPFWLEVGFSAVGFAAVLMMVEAPYRDDEGGKPAADTMAKGKLARAMVIRLAPIALFTSVICMLPELTHFHLPAELATELGLTPLHLGFLYAGFELLQGLGNKLAGSKRFDQPLRILPWVGAGLLTCFAVFGMRALLGIAAYVLARAGVDFLYGLAEPLISEETNKRTGSSVRATSLSIINAGRMLLPVSVLPLSTVLVTGLPYSTAYLIMLAAIGPVLAFSGYWLVASGRGVSESVIMPER